MSKMKTSLYNNDGTLSAQAQSLLSPKPDDMSMGEWINLSKEFRSQLSKEDRIIFKRLKDKERRRNRKDYIKSYNKFYYESNKVSSKELARKSQRANPERTKRNNIRWKLSNPERVKQHSLNARSKPNYYTKRAQTEKKRRKLDPIFCLKISIRKQCNRVVKQLSLGKKPASTFKWVGCSPEELKARFESLFVEGMSWDNYGEWHVDHIRPVSSFKPEEWEQINHYTNLQPLWAEDNLVKRNYFV
jgi:hypothetical protein